MNNRVITRERGVIPGCKAAGSNYGMAVDRAGRPWSRSPSDIDAYLAKLRAETRQSRINRGADPETGIKLWRFAPISPPSSGWNPYGPGASDFPSRQRNPTPTR